MPDVLIERASPEVAVVTLNRPATLNSLTLAMVGELTAAFDALAADRTVRVVVVTGAGRGFCSGHELGEFVAQTAPEWMDVQEAFANLTLRIHRMPQPVIAAVNGPAAGGGLAIALAADIRVGSESARFNAAFVRIGLSGCDVGVSYLLPRIVGPTAAFEMMLTGRLVDADEAHRTGLLLQVTSDGKVVDAALAIAEGICANTPFGVRMTAEVMRANLDAASLEAAIALENRTQVLCLGTADHHEAVAAFRARRPPAPFRNA